MHALLSGADLFFEGCTASGDLGSISEAPHSAAALGIIEAIIGKAVPVCSEGVQGCCGLDGVVALLVRHPAGKK